MSAAESSILDDLRPGSFILSLNGRPFRQSQDDSWSIRRAVYTDYDLFVCYGGRGKSASIREGLFTVVLFSFLRDAPHGIPDAV